MTEGKVITCRAAVCWAINEPLTVEDVQIDPPQKGEVRVKIVATSLCFSDASVQIGKIPSPGFPIILGHEGAGIVESVGEGVTAFKKGDHIIPLFLPQCKSCVICKHPTANWCLKFAISDSTGLMPDGTSRITCRGKKVFTFIGCSTFSEYAVLADINLCKINEKAPLEKVCLFSCGVSTGYGAAVNTAKVQPGSSCAVWGLGALGLAAILGCKNSGASRIFAIDVNPDKFEMAKQFGATDFINPKELDKPIQDHLRGLTEIGVDYTFEAVGNIHTMKQAFESAAMGYGVCVLIGLPPEGQLMKVVPGDFLTGKSFTGTIFGGYKSVDSVPKLVEEYLEGKLEIDTLITHNMELEKINDAFDLLKSGKCIRTMIKMA